MNWTDRAACRGMDDTLFFPEGRGHIAIEAYATCTRCPVRDHCLNEAIDRTNADDYGIWGGTSERDRIDIRRGHATRQQAMARGDRRGRLPYDCGCTSCRRTTAWRVA